MKSILCDNDTINRQRRPKIFYFVLSVDVYRNYTAQNCRSEDNKAHATMTEREITRIPEVDTLEMEIILPDPATTSHADNFFLFFSQNIFCSGRLCL